MTDRTAAQILTDHATRFNGGKRLVWSDLTTTERANLRDADLRGADLWRADLRGADLGAANLRDADLRGADLWRADLRGADLGAANLRGADLRGADLWRADLRGADLSRGLAIVQGPTRSDGYFFSLRVCCLGEHVVVAGCRSFTIEQYRQHVADEYSNTPKAAETLAILDFLEVRRDQIFAEWGGL